MCWCSSLRPRRFLCPSTEPMQRELEKDVGVYGRSSDPRCLFLLPGEGNCPLLKFPKSHSNTASRFKANKWMAHHSPDMDKVAWTQLFGYNSSWLRDLLWPSWAAVVCLLPLQQGTQPTYDPALFWGVILLLPCVLAMTLWSWGSSFFPFQYDTI